MVCSDDGWCDQLVLEVVQRSMKIDVLTSVIMLTLVAVKHQDSTTIQMGDSGGDLLIMDKASLESPIFLNR
jgi:hypothetical protein